MQSAAVLPLLAFGAMAQDSAQLTEVKKKLEESMVRMNMVGAVKGPLVKGMPYSGEEVNETNQVLADGTRIHRETKTMVYRDSEGRTRRESPENITISDPVAGTTYMINPKTNAVRRLQMSNTMVYRATGGAAVGGGGRSVVVPDGDHVATFSVRTDGDGQANIEVNGKKLDPKAVAELMAKAKAEGRAEAREFEIMALPRPDGVAAGTFTAGVPAAGPVMIRKMMATGKGESLGKKNVEGVIAEGMRNVETIEQGAIGNDRAIQIVNESWFSEELGMMVYSKRSDPRTGEETFRLMNIRRGDPPAYLFQAPAETPTVHERKM
jgi:hypothetical protein